VIDKIIEEPAGGAHRDPETTIAATKEAVLAEIKRLKRTSGPRLAELRYKKFANMGRYRKTRKQ